MKQIFYTCLFCLLLGFGGHVEATNPGSTAPSERADVFPECPERSGKRKSASGRSDEGLRAKILEEQATVEELRSAFTNTKMIELVNSIDVMVRYDHRPEVVSLWREVWSANEDKYPDFNWSCLEHPFLRVSLALVLAQGDGRNHDIYYQYIRQNLEHENLFVRASAAGALGIIGSDRDIPTLEQMVLSDNVYVANSAMSGLFSIKSDKAKEAIQRLYYDPAVAPETKDLIERFRKLPN